MSSEVRTTSVVILGRDYKIRTTESEEFVRDVARFVDEMMNRISSKMSSGTTSQIAVLAALNIAEELFRERRNGHAAASVDGSSSGDEADERMRAVLHRVEELLDVAKGKRAKTSVRSTVSS